MIESELERVIKSHFCNLILFENGPYPRPINHHVLTGKNLETILQYQGFTCFNAIFVKPKVEMWANCSDGRHTAYFPIDEFIQRRNLSKLRLISAIATKIYDLERDGDLLIHRKPHYLKQFLDLWIRGLVEQDLKKIARKNNPFMSGLTLACRPSNPLHIPSIINNFLRL